MTGFAKRTHRARPKHIHIPEQHHEVQALHGELHSAKTPTSASFTRSNRSSPLKPTLGSSQSMFTSPRHKRSLASDPGTPIHATRPSGTDCSNVFNQGVQNLASPTQNIAVDRVNKTSIGGEDEDGDDDMDDPAVLESFALPAPTPAEIAAERRRLRTIYNPLNPPPDDPVTAEGLALGILPDVEGRKWREQLMRLGRWAASGHTSYVSGQYGPPVACQIERLHPEERLVLDIDFLRAPVVSRRPVKGGKARNDPKEYYWAKRNAISPAVIVKRRGRATTLRPQPLGPVLSGPKVSGQAAQRTPVSALTPTAQIFGEWAGRNHLGSGPIQSPAGATSTTNPTRSKLYGPPSPQIARYTRKGLRTDASGIQRITLEDSAIKQSGPPPQPKQPSRTTAAASQPKHIKLEPTSVRTVPRPSKQTATGSGVSPQQPVEIAPGIWDAPEYILPVGRPQTDTTTQPNSKSKSQSRTQSQTRMARARGAGVSRPARATRAGMQRPGGSGRGRQAKAVSWAPLPSDEARM